MNDPFVENVAKAFERGDFHDLYYDVKVSQEHMCEILRLIEQTLTDEQRHAISRKIETTLNKYNSMKEAIEQNCGDGDTIVVRKHAREIGRFLIDESADFLDFLSDEALDMPIDKIEIGSEAGKKVFVVTIC